MKNIRIEFEGGFWPGLCLDSQSSVREHADLARAYYRMIAEGTIAGLFRRLALATARVLRARGWSSEQIEQAGFDGNHTYVLAERIETERDIVLRFTYSSTNAIEHDDFFS